jgi:hypothetical protein
VVARTSGRAWQGRSRDVKSAQQQCSVGCLSPDVNMGILRRQRVGAGPARTSNESALAPREQMLFRCAVETIAARIQHTTLSSLRKRKRHSFQRRGESSPESAVGARAGRGERKRAHAVTCPRPALSPPLLADCVLSPPPALFAHALSQFLCATATAWLTGSALAPRSPAPVSSLTSHRPPSPALAHEHHRATSAEFSNSQPHRELLLSASPA